MRLRKLLLLAIVFIAGISQAQMQMPPIPLDSAVRIGKLDNGLTYSILITTSPLRLSTLLTRSKSWRKSSWLLRTKPGA